MKVFPELSKEAFAELDQDIISEAFKRAEERNANQIDPTALRNRFTLHNLADVEASCGDMETSPEISETEADRDFIVDDDHVSYASEDSDVPATPRTPSVSRLDTPLASPKEARSSYPRCSECSEDDFEDPQSPQEPSSENPQPERDTEPENPQQEQPENSQDSESQKFFLHKSSPWGLGDTHGF